MPTPQSSWANLNEERKLELNRLYDESSDVYVKRYKETQLEKFKLVRRDRLLRGIVLDAGCGPCFLREYIEEYFGIDISQKLLLSCPKGRVVRGDVERMPYPNSTFDTVLSITVLQNVPHKARFISEIKRVLVPGGMVIVTALRKSLSEKEVIRLLSNSGFREIEKLDLEGTEDIGAIGKKELDYRGVSEYKSKGGLIRCRCSVSEGKISEIKISGDFFLYPEEAITQLEDHLTGSRASYIHIASILEEFWDKVRESPGLCPRDLAIAISRAL